MYDRRRDAVFDEGMVGTWRGADGTVAISRGRGRSYVFRSPEGDAQARKARLVYDLVPIGRGRYLFPQARGGGVGTPLFMSYQVDRRGRQLRLRGLNVAALADRLVRGQGPLAYAELDNRNGVPRTVRPGTRPATAPATRPAAERSKFTNLILTDSPRRIRQYLTDHEDDPELFDSEVVLTRVRR
ncbi:MAG TPA: hypothetical protein VFY65_01360 [Longimicrobium sp.]|nr:hypothetical protein [Longimicrobium sp.]